MIPYDLPEPKKPTARRLRRVLLPIVLWAFGISTTVFLIGNWGHSASGDQEALAESARTAIGADVVADRVTDWLSDGLAAAAGLPASTVRTVAAEVQRTPEADVVLDHLVDEGIRVLLAAPGSESSVDLGMTLAPLVPIVEAELGDRGINVPPGLIASSLAEVEPLRLATAELESAAAVARQTRALLSRVLLIALLAMATTGATAVALSEDRLAMVRSLAMRVAVSGFSFIVIFNLAAWALDPQRGRSPLLGSGGVLLGSNLHTFSAIAVPAMLIFVATAFVVWRRARGANGEPVTQELAPV